MSATVLIIEDEPEIRELIRLNLELEGYRVVVAEDGERGLEAARCHHPDVVLLDVMLPKLDGWEVLARLKAQPDEALANVPVLMLTARTGTMDRLRGGIEGAIRYLTKPFSPEDLVGEVEAALEGEPEPQRRRHTQAEALSELARMETGSGPDDPATPRPRLSRLQSEPSAPSLKHVQSVVAVSSLESLSAKQRGLLDTVGATPTVSEAAERLGVSRSNVYASLRRTARKVGVGSVSELVRLARAGGLG